MTALPISKDARYAAAKACREFDIELCHDEDACPFDEDVLETQLEYGAQAERVIRAFLQAEGFEVESDGDEQRVCSRWKPAPTSEGGEG